MNKLNITITFVPLAICYPAVTEENQDFFLLNCMIFKWECCKSYFKSSPEGKI